MDAEPTSKTQRELAGLVRQKLDSQGAARLSFRIVTLPAGEKPNWDIVHTMPRALTGLENRALSTARDELRRKFVLPKQV